ncbi:MAG: RND transporter [Caulobacterales bacterium 68-7]|nr:MAG: RND transporter [Caulobacterales bacterium 68-7]
MRRFLPPIVLSMLAIALAGCVTPRVSEIAERPAAKGAFVSAGSPAFAPAEPSGAWWRLYADPKLDSLVAEALEHNRDLAAAEATLEQVRASLSEARASYLPTTQVTTGYTRGRLNPQMAPAGADRDYEIYQAGANLNYEVDLFGRVRRAVAAARADRDAAAAAVDLVRLTVASETARAYADTCAANVQISVANRSIELQSRTAGLTRTLLDTGRGAGLDVARAEAALQNTRASLPPLRAQRDGALFRLAALTGKTPAEADSVVRDCAKIPQLTAAIPVGDGAGLLGRRPDIRQAERQLDAATARAGVAAAALFPTVTLGGTWSSMGLEPGDLGESAGVSFTAGPLISWNFPNVFAARARMKAASAGADVALARFDQTMLGALRDTETALSTYANELDRRTALAQARDRASDAVRLSQLRFDQGADSFLTLLDTQRTLVQAEAALAQSDAQVTANQVAVFQALGGGWQTP